MYTLNNAGVLADQVRAVRKGGKLNDLVQTAGCAVVRIVCARKSRNDRDDVPEMLRGAIFLKL
jgi:hypothetical protein